MTQELHERATLMYEGQALTLPSQHGHEVGIAIIKGAIDGHMNGLIRTVGTREAARFAFSLTDRVVAGIRAPTDLPPIEPIALPKITERPAQGLTRFDVLAFFGVLLAMLRWRA